MKDYSIIAETIDATGSQEAGAQIIGELSTGTVHAWRTNAKGALVQLPDLTPQNGSFSVKLEPDSIYSLTTTTGQSKGNAQRPAGAPFPFPYTDNFNSASLGKSPKYFSD